MTRKQIYRLWGGVILCFTMIAILLASFIIGVDGVISLPIIAIFAVLGGVGVVQLVGTTERYEMATEQETQVTNNAIIVKSKSKRRIIIPSVLILVGLVFAGGGTGLIYNTVNRPVHYDTLSYQSQRYYGTGLIQPAISFDKASNKVSLFAAKRLSDHIWSLNGISEKKLVVQRIATNGQETFTSQKLGTPAQAIHFLNPKYVIFNTDNQETMYSFTVAGQKELLSVLGKTIMKKPRYSLVMPPEKGMKDFHEIYMYNSKVQSALVQASLVKDSQGTVDLYFSGDMKMEYWPVSKKLLDLLTVKE